MKLARVALIPLLAALPPSEPDELRVAYSTGEVVQVEERDWMTMEQSDLSVRLNGEELPEETLGEMGIENAGERQEDRVRTTTWLDAVEDGQPVRGTRRFDAVARTKVEGEEESEEEGALLGRTLLLSGSAGESEVEARLVDGDEGPPIDDVYLEHHRLAYDMESYLPAQAVAQGDTWQLEEAAVREILGFSAGDPTYFASDRGEDDAFGEVLRRSAEVSGEVAYEGREEVDGVACAVLVISLQVKLDATEVDPAAFDIEEEEGLETSARVELELAGEERLWFALELGHPVRSEAQYEGSMRLSVAMSNDELKMDMDFGMKIAGGFEGAWSYEDR